MLVRTSSIYLFAATAFAQMPSLPGPPASAGPQHGYFQMQSTAGPRVYFNAKVEPPVSDPDELKLNWRVLQTITSNKEVLHRYVVDPVNKQYFGYDLTVTPVTGGSNTSQLEAGSYQIVFSPLTVQPDQLQPSGLTPAAMPKYPDPQTVTPGDSIALDLLVSPDGKRKIVDYIQIAPPGPVDPPAATSTAAPKDYTLDDGPIHFDFGGYLAINGQKFQGLTWFFVGRNGGATLWFCLPGIPGRYILSLQPSTSLTKMGVVRDNAVQFSASGEQYEVRMQNPVIGRGAWNLYGLYDPSHGTPEDSPPLPGPVPTGAITFSGGTDRLESLLSH